MQIAYQQINGYSVFVRQGTPDVQVAESCFGTEFSMICEMLSSIEMNNTVLDLGGYIGTAAIKFATAIPNSIVVTVEPSPENFKILQLNTARYKNIIAVNAAVGPVEGSMPIFSRGTGEWGHTLVAKPKDCATPRLISEVNVDTVQGLLEKYSPKTNVLSLAKIDIEGAEAFILEDERLNEFAVLTAELHDRIQPGCTEAWGKALAGSSRIEILPKGEKHTTIDVDRLKTLYS